MLSLYELKFNNIEKVIPTRKARLIYSDIIKTVCQLTVDMLLCHRRPLRRVLINDQTYIVCGD